MEKKIYAPTIAQIERSQSLRFGEYCSVTKQTKEMISLLMERLMRLQAYRDDECWRFWVYAFRGPIEAFGNYEELHESGEYDTYDDFVRTWKRIYNNDMYWYEVSVSRYKEFFSLCINDSLVINLSPEKVNTWFEWDCVQLIEFLIEHVEKIIAGVQDGTYNQWLDSVLPYRYRTGVILRKVLWKIDRRYKKWSLRDLTEQEIADYIAYSNQDALIGKTTERIKNMTAQRYFDICAICYRGAKYEDVDKMTSEQMYLRFADDRDGGLRTFDHNSPEEFDKWYALSTDEKWKIENPSHLWELRAGSSYTRIHLYLSKDKDGYYVSLSGAEEACTDDLVRMYCALKRNNIPVNFYEREIIAKKIIGDDYVGIVPCTDAAWRYSYGSFPKEGVISFLSFNLEDVPKKNEHAVIRSTDWFPLKLQHLK